MNLWYNNNYAYCDFLSKYVIIIYNNKEKIKIKIIACS